MRREYNCEVVSGRPNVNYTVNPTSTTGDTTENGAPERKVEDSATNNAAKSSGFSFIGNTTISTDCSKRQWRSSNSSRVRVGW